MLLSSVILSILGVAEGARLPQKSAPQFQRRQDDVGDVFPVGYENYNCDKRNTDISISPSDRWSNAYAGDGWNAAVDNWQNKDRALGLKFGASISNFFGGPDGYNCQTTHGGSCETQIGCKDVDHDAGCVAMTAR
jgi:hypothetical protein